MAILEILLVIGIAAWSLFSFMLMLYLINEGYEDNLWVSVSLIILFLLFCIETVRGDLLVSGTSLILITLIFLYELLEQMDWISVLLGLDILGIIGFLLWILNFLSYQAKILVSLSGWLMIFFVLWLVIKGED